jgi:predicted amidohydrolase
MVKFSEYAIPKLKQASKEKTIILTMLSKDKESVKNFAYVFHKGEIVRKQAKSKLFKFGDEHLYMQSGDEKEIDIFEIEGIKIGILICFELRFKKFWQKLEGCDIIAVPSFWGVLREQNFKILTTALAIINECYVVASDSKNEQYTKQSGIITPFGEEYRNNSKSILSIDFDKNEIKKMRRYMDIGIK